MDTAAAWTAHGFSGLDDLVFGRRDVPEPGPGEISVAIAAAGVNPADLKHLRRSSDPALLPMPIGYEIAGTVTRIGPGGESEASGPHLGSGEVPQVGHRVVAFRVRGGYAEALTIPAADAFTLPASVDDDAAAGLLLAGCTAAELLARSGARPGETVLVHGASGAVGAILLQLARRAGVSVIGTAGPTRLDAVRQFGATALEYGPGLAWRVREAAPGGVDAVLDCAGAADAVDASLELVADRSRILTVAAPVAAREHRFVTLSGSDPDSAKYRNSVRAQLISLLADGELDVPIAQIFPLSEARAALALVSAGHAHGKVVLTPGA